MATDLHAMTAAVVYESGHVLGNQEALRLLSESVRTLNARVGSGFTLSPAPGAEATRAFLLDRDASDLEQRALILLSVLMWLQGESRKWSFDAIKHSNAAGSTNLDGVEFALSKRAKELLALKELGGELDGILAILGTPSSAGVLAGAGHQELGESLPGSVDGWYGWGPYDPGYPWWGP